MTMSQEIEGCFLTGHELNGPWTTEDAIAWWAHIKHLIERAKAARL